jgi:hypothetical protein
MGMKKGTFDAVKRRNKPSHPSRHLAGGRFSEPKTLSPFDARTVTARHKVEVAKRILGPWRMVGAWLGNQCKAGACCRLVKDDTFRPSIALIALIEVSPLPQAKVEVAPCPSCGLAHVAPDCHGAPVASVVILAPGETVRPFSASRPRPERTTIPITRATRDTLRACKPAGLSWSIWLLSLLAPD